jgi:heterodisulfide reductase subunit D
MRIIGERKMPLELSFRQMIELEGCTRCGECTQGCPAFAATQDQRVTPLEAFRTAKDWMISRSRLKKFFLRSKSVDPERLKAFSNEVFQCTLCGHCNEVCPVHYPFEGDENRPSKKHWKIGLTSPQKDCLGKR